MAYTIAIERTNAPKTKPETDKLVFGTSFTDHMFMLNFDAGQGWHSPRVVPYQPVALDPAAKVFHYGQTVFEGLKAFKTADGAISLFRPEMNFRRLNRSNDRLSIPRLDEELALAGLKTLIRVDADWIPADEGTSLYIRPFIIATQPALGVAPSENYLFMIILSPVGAYYKEGVSPVKIHVESDYVRAVPGGVGNAKTAGNYAAGLKAQEEAPEGYSQVLWLDGVHRKFIEEVGSMNMFFKIGGKVVTPALNGSILEGITRDSMIRLLEHWGIPVEQRQISIDEIAEAHRSGTLEEAFGTGTAAVISPVGELHWQGEKLVIGGGATGELSARLYETLTGIQRGIVPDPFGWMVRL